MKQKKKKKETEKEENDEDDTKHRVSARQLHTACGGRDSPTGNAIVIFALVAM